MERIKIVFVVNLGVVMAVLLAGYQSALVPTTAAQMGTDANMTDNNTSGMKGQYMMSHMKGENVTGSINLMSIFSKAIGAEVKVSLSEAATSAESNVGKWLSCSGCSHWSREWIPCIQCDGYRS